MLEFKFKYFLGKNNKYIKISTLYNDKYIVLMKRNFIKKIIFYKYDIGTI